jgi:streptomycin 3"-adenylyltransferase
MDIINKFVNKSQDILKENLKGIYLHGSSVMGCFNPEKSDIDLIVVVNDNMSDAIKKAYMDMVVNLNSYAPAKGIEMSIVRNEVCNPFIYPTPFELHFSAMHLKWYRDNPEDYIRKMNGTDKDLAAHFTIIRKRGKCLYGLPIEDAFAEVPKTDYMDSIWNDIEEAPEEITENTMYLTLNMARVLAFAKDGLVLSKKEGGEWGLKNVPEEYHNLIEDALSEYGSSIIPQYDKELSVKYAEYMLGSIRKTVPMSLN